METRPTWPGWENVRLIGKGSFGAVYEIQRDVFGTLEKAALKVISIPQSESDVAELQADGYDMASISERYNSYLKEIVNEYSLMAALKGNSNIVDCDDLHYTQHEDGIGWDILIKMELLEPVTKVFTGDISEEQAIRLGKDICQALILCKKRNIVHRDIKPQNIFISRDGVFKLGDFGIAKVAESTTTGTKTGTYRYMAPEVYNNRPYGGAADIYSLGMVLYWMLNEKRSPFLPLPPRVPSAQMEEDAKYRRFAGEAIPEPAHGTDALKRIVLKACAFDPENRYKQPEEMLQDLEQLTSVAGEKRSSFVQADLDATILDEEPSGHTNGNQPEPMDEWPETLGEMKKRMDETFRGQPAQMDASFRGQASQMDTSFHGQPAAGAAQGQPYGQPGQSITQFGEFLAPPGQNPVQPGQGLAQFGQGLTQSGHGLTQSGQSLVQPGQAASGKKQNAGKRKGVIIASCIIALVILLGAGAGLFFSLGTPADPQTAIETKVSEDPYRSLLVETSIDLAEYGITEDRSLKAFPETGVFGHWYTKKSYGETKYQDLSAAENTINVASVPWEFLTTPAMDHQMLVGFKDQQDEIYYWACQYRIKAIAEISYLYLMPTENAISGVDCPLLKEELVYIIGAADGIIRVESQDGSYAYFINSIEAGEKAVDAVKGTAATEADVFNELGSLDMVYQYGAKSGKGTMLSFAMTLENGDEPLNPDPTFYETSRGIVANWKKVDRFYNGKVSEFSESGYLPVVYIINNYPYGFTAINNGEYYVYLNSK